MPRSKSSKLWLREHFEDPYVKRAQAEGYRARAAYKLLEIQEKEGLIKPGMVVVDLGAAPGSWSQVARRLVGSKGHVVALDCLPMEPIEGVDFLQGDFTELAVLNELLSLLGGNRVDLVLSDIAPNTSGIKAVDVPRAMYMAELALDFARQALGPHGGFLVKVFQGEGFDPFLREMRRTFKSVKICKPKASRPRSRELFLKGSDPA